MEDGHQARRHLRQRRRRLQAVFEQFFRRRAAGEGRSAGQQVAEGAAEAVQVGAGIHPPRVAGLLRSEEIHRANDDTELRQGRSVAGRSGAVGLICRRARPRSSSLTMWLLVAQQLARLDVAVDQPPFVSVLQAQAPPDGYTRRRLVGGSGRASRTRRLRSTPSTYSMTMNIPASVSPAS